MRRRLKAIAAAAAIIAPVATMAIPASPASAQSGDPDIVSLRIVGSDWEEYIPEGSYTVYEDELPQEWSISLDSPEAESVRWTVNGQVDPETGEEESHPWLITRNSSDGWEPADWAPGTYDIMATAFTEDGHTGSSNAFETRLVIEPGTRPSFDFVVNAGFDAHDTNPGDGQCAAVVDGQSHCTLRAAVEELNATGGGRIALKTYIWSYELELGELDITTPMGIIGLHNGKATIRTNGQGRVFDIDSPNSVTLLDNLEITGGDVTNNAPGDRAGGNINVVNSSLWLNNSQVSGSSAVIGGGIYFEQETDSSHYLYITNTRVDHGHALHGPGGGLFAEGVANVQIENSEFVENTAITGGGIAVRGGDFQGQPNDQPRASVKISGTVVAHNEIIMPGGSGIQLHYSDAEISYTTVADNVAQHSGGTWTSPDEAGGIWVDNPRHLTLKANALTGNTFTPLGSTYAQSAECATSYHSGFIFRPGNFVEELNSTCTIDTNHSTRVAEATGTPAYEPTDPYSGYRDYVVSYRSPLWGLGIGSDAHCPTFDVYGNKRATDGGCAAGAVAMNLPVTQTEEISAEITAVPMVVEAAPIAETTPSLEPLPSISTVPSIDLGPGISLETTLDLTLGR